MIMKPDHPRWGEFYQLMNDALVDISGCEHDHRHARKILADLGFDVDGSIAFFEKNGGFCDCEIMMNVRAARRMQ